MNLKNLVRVFLCCLFAVSVSVLCWQQIAHAGVSFCTITGSNQKVTAQVEFAQKQAGNEVGVIFKPILSNGASNGSPLGWFNNYLPRNNPSSNLVGSEWNGPAGSIELQPGCYNVEAVSKDNGPNVNAPFYCEYSQYIQKISIPTNMTVMTFGPLRFAEPSVNVGLLSSVTEPERNTNRVICSGER